MFLSLDTNVVIAATVGEPDRLSGAWAAFDAREPRKRFITRAVVDEFLGTVEGVGRDAPGIVSELISDALNAIRFCGDERPSEAKLVSKGLRNPRLERVLRLIQTVSDSSDVPWDPAKARNAIRTFEIQYATRKQAFFEAHPVFDPTNETAVQTLKRRVFEIVPTGGAAWANDCLILAQVTTVLRERELAGEFVSEDRRHLAPHSRAITQLTGLLRIRDLNGNAF